LPSPETAGYKLHFDGPSAAAVRSEDQPDVHPLIAFEGLAANRIDVPDGLAITDPLILKTQRLLNRSKLDANGLIIVPPRSLYIHTSRALHERACRLMQVLMTAFERRDFRVTTTEKGTCVTILDEPLGVGIVEGTKAVEHRTTFTDQKLIDRGLGYQVPKFDYVPSGSVTLFITNVSHVRQRWSDSTKPLEQSLNKFVTASMKGRSTTHSVPRWGRGVCVQPLARPALLPASPPRGACRASYEGCCGRSALGVRQGLFCASSRRSPYV
jgi:hypothetical protein